MRIPSPTTATPTAPVAAEDEWNWEGTYDLAAAPTAGAAATPSRPGPDYGWGAAYDLGESPPPPAPADGPAATGAAFDGSDGPPPPVAAKFVRPPAEATRSAPPEPWFPPALFYPLRGMEGVVVVVSLGVAVWIIGTLVPEYCLGLIADGEKLGAPTMGHLVTLVTSIPVLLLAPLVATYWLQYLARVLVSGAEGERNPPRPPDRNLDGLLSGMGSWLAWAVLGLGVGLVPLAIGWAAGVHAPGGLLALALVGWPYAAMALLLSFLDEDDLAARPWRVAAALARGGPGFLALSAVVAGVLAVAGGAYLLALQLRPGAFWAYVLLGLPCGMIAVAMTIVGMYTLGCYHHSRDRRGRRRRAATRGPDARATG